LLVARPTSKAIVGCPPKVKSRCWLFGQDKKQFLVARPTSKAVVGCPANTKRRCWLSDHCQKLLLVASSTFTRSSL